MGRSSRRFRTGVAIAFLPLALVTATASSQPTGARGTAGVPSNASVDEIRRASVSWEWRPGPGRKVVDQVCLVPDLPTFLDAIATWDDTHSFPILIDDVELTFKFLRAFRPARVVRYPRRADPIPPERLWKEAVAAVGRSWTGASAVPPEATAGAMAGDAVPRRLGATPPGVVFSAPSSPMLAGAVALAAGRFQPLIRCEIPRHYADVLTRDEAGELARGLEAQVAGRVAGYDKLGDECDFLTLAGDWPFRYRDKDGEAAFDDLIGRSSANQARWAFTGRLLGDTTSSVYRAMCSLFLQPESALLLNTYTDPSQPWNGYALAQAADRLAKLAPVTLREGSGAGMSEYSRLFDPVNRFGLILINSHGSPTEFNLPGGPGKTEDIPPSVPTAVLMIHSFSAADPTDPRTIAGRWLAQGAFVYFGSMNEPYLQSFRPPAMVAGMIAEGLPLGAACRRNPPEPFGQPWRLVYLGDPLYQVQPRDRRVTRLDRWAPSEAWPAYSELPQPGAEATESIRLDWALKAALFLSQRTARPKDPINLPTSLLSIRRERLDAPLRSIHDALLIDVLLQAEPIPTDLLLDRLNRIPAADRSPVVRRTLESFEMAARRRVEQRGADRPGASTDRTGH